MNTREQMAIYSLCSMSLQFRASFATILNRYEWVRTKWVICSFLNLHFFAGQKLHMYTWIYLYKTLRRSPVTGKPLFLLKYLKLGKH